MYNWESYEPTNNIAIITSHFKKIYQIRQPPTILYLIIFIVMGKENMVKYKNMISSLITYYFSQINGFYIYG